MKAADDPAPEQKPFLGHLEDFRLMVIRSAAALAVGMGIAIPLIPSILKLLTAPLKGVSKNPDFALRSIGVVDGFTAVMQMAFWTGLLFSIPFIVLFAGAFVLPALTRREQGLVYRASGFAVALFVFGVWLGYTFTLPFALQA
ncbi:MAG TPA: twin-arginine translocase subunit TatC, partial [Kiritimatiellia bacterium]